MSTGAIREQDDVNAALDELHLASQRLAGTTAEARAALARQCLTGVAQVSDEWARTTAAAKGLEADSPWIGEELATGPMAIARQLQLLAASLEGFARTGTSPLPGAPHQDGRGRLRVPVLPVKGLYDGIAFKGFTAEVVMEEGILEEDLPDHTARSLRRPETGVSLVLGAGNVSSIAVADTIQHVLAEGQPTALKLHPHFDGLAPLLETALGPLVRPGYIRIVRGGAEVGAAAAHDPRVHLVHVTGSRATFDRIVWGNGRETHEGRAQGTPSFDKRLVAELGNVTPWIVVPGEWTDKEVRFQAENLAGSILSNASFNCICPKVIVTSRRWRQRELFLETLRSILAAVPPRPAFYPGATQRFMELVGEPAGVAPGHLPWTLLRDTDPDTRPELFEQENFVCITAETSLDEVEPAGFLEAATTFVNERTAGTLATTIVVHPSQRAAGPVGDALERAVERLRFGTVCINQFAGISYLMMSTPWGGFPGSTLDDPGSGMGFAHNTYLLDGIEKTVFEGPFRISPKPLWFPSNRNTVGIGRALTELYLRPSPLRVPSLLAQALRG